MREDDAGVLWFSRLNPSSQTLNDRTENTHHDWLNAQNNIVRHNRFHYNSRIMRHAQRSLTPDWANVYVSHRFLQLIILEPKLCDQNPARSTIGLSPMYVCHIVYWRGELSYQALSPSPYSSIPCLAKGRHQRQHSPTHGLK